MLQFIRDRAQSWIAVVIVGMLILALGAFAWDSYFRADPVVAAATVNGEKITAIDFQRNYQNQRARLQEMLGGADISQIIPDEEKYKKDILDQLVKEELINQSAIDSGYRVGDLYLGQRIRSFQSFQTDGQFDTEKYQRLLRQNLWSPAAYEEVVRKEVLIQQYRQAVMGTAWVSKSEQDLLLQKQEQQRDIGFLNVPLSGFIDAIEISEEEARDHYDQNSSQYMTPEQVSVEYLDLSVSDLMASVVIEDNELIDLYESRKMDFTVPEERRTRHILVEVTDEMSESDALTKAQELLASIKDGKSFEEVAKESSDDFGSAEQGGDLGYMGRDAMMDEALADAAFSLSAGEVSEPVKTEFGYHLVKLEDIASTQAKTFEEVRGQLEEEYRKQQAEEMFYDKGEILANMAFENPDSLEPAADEAGLEIKSTSLFTRDSGLSIAMDSRVRDSAFSDDVLIGGNNSEPLELDAQRVVVLRIKEHHETAQRPFDNVKESIVGTLRNLEAEKRAEAAGQELLSQLNEGGDIEALSKEKGWEWQALGLTKRVGAVGDREVVDYSFKMAHPVEDKPVYNGFAKRSGDYAVVALFSVKDGDTENVEEAQRQNIVQRRQRTVGITELVGAMDSLRESATVTDFPENL